MEFLLINTAGGYGFISANKKHTPRLPLSPPLGLLYIGKSLEDEGHKVKIIEYFGEEHPKKKIKKILPSLNAVGISISTANYKNAVQLTEMIRKSDPSLPIIIGGPHCTFHPKKSLKEIPNANISVEGEGDFVIKNIAKSLAGKLKLSEISGIHYRTKNSIKSGKPIKIIKDLDSLPFPARHLVNKYDYGKINTSYLFKPKITSIITSRGCLFNCRFCTRHCSTYQTYRQRSAENVIKEIQKISERYGSVLIVDDNFLTDRKRIHKIMDRIIELNLEIELLISAARVDSANEELYKKMKKAGVKYIGFGIESGSQEVLDFYNKKTTLHQIRKAVNLSRKMNFVTTGHFIFGAPIESEDHIKQTIKFACSLPLDIALFSPLYYMYGSDLWNESVESGKIDENDGYWVSADSGRDLGNFPEETLVTLCKTAARKFYVRPSYIAREISRSIMRKDFRLLKTGILSL